MNAKQTLEKLTNSWYGYALFGAVLSFFSIRASGVFALAVGVAMTAVLNVVALVISFAIIAFLGRALIARSAGTRRFLVFVSGLFTLLGILGTVGAAWSFLHVWSLAGALSIVTSAVGTMMNARSFNVLTATKVKAYFV